MLGFFYAGTVTCSLRAQKFKKNEKVNVETAASITAVSINNYCLDILKDLELEASSAWIVFMELFALGYHICKRYAFSIFGPKKGSIFMKLLFNDINKGFKETLKDNLEIKIVRLSVENSERLILARDLSYSKYEKLINQEPVGTLLWDFAKKNCRCYFSRKISGEQLFSYKQNLYSG